MDSKEHEADTEIENADEDQGITMVDVLEQENEMEKNYAAVLAASDEKSCTYTKGSIKRQALYSCLTCCPEMKDNLDKCAGICLACSYNCHENHELIELYTKRNFRCDCPTERFKDNRCTLNTAFVKPQPVNVENKYNQNFQGIYCNCHRPYPDPERTTEEVMLQCCVCEDWFHLQHANAPPGAAKLVDTCDEMICNNCMDRCEFLSDYLGYSLKAIEQESRNLDAVNVVKTDTNQLSNEKEDNDDNKLRSDLDKSISEIMNINELVGTGAENPKVQKRTHEAENITEEPNAKRAKLNEAASKEDEVDVKAKPSAEIDIAEKLNNDCRRPKQIKEYEKGATLWPTDWRTKLCKCDKCLALYQEKNVEFLLDAEDSTNSYEERGMKRAASESSFDQGMRALASIGRTQQIDVITEYNHMKDKLKEFLQTFAINKKIVKEEDISRFFEEMRKEKNGGT